MKRKRNPKYDADGVPIDQNDWEHEDWRILWLAISTAKAAIAERHKERREEGER